MNWEPIETAPRDGTEILIWDGYEMITVRWRPKGFYPARWQLVQAGNHADCDSPDTPPIFWQSLPLPPQ